MACASHRTQHGPRVAEITATPLSPQKTGTSIRTPRSEPCRVFPPGGIGARQLFVTNLFRRFDVVPHGHWSRYHIPRHDWALFRLCVYTLSLKKEKNSDYIIIMCADPQITALPAELSSHRPDHPIQQLLKKRQTRNPFVKLNLNTKSQHLQNGPS